MADTVVTPDQILKFSLFSDLSQNKEALKELASLMKLEVFNARDFIIDENKSDSKMFFLLSGKVEVNKMDEKGTIVPIGRADASTFPYFGESILFGNFTRTANVVAHAQCECLSLTAKDFEAFMKTHPFAVATFYRQLAKVIFNRLSKANKDIFLAGLSMIKN